MTIVTQQNTTHPSQTYADLAQGDYFMRSNSTDDIYLKTNIKDPRPDEVHDIVAVRISGPNGIGNRCRLHGYVRVTRLETLSLDPR